MSISERQPHIPHSKNPEAGSHARERFRLEDGPVAWANDAVQLLPKDITYWLAVNPFNRDEIVDDVALEIRKHYEAACRLAHNMEIARAITGVDFVIKRARILRLRGTPDVVCRATVEIVERMGDGTAYYEPGVGWGTTQRPRQSVRNSTLLLKGFRR